MLPTFLIIGAMKCGTTSLYYYLAEHPDIGMSRRKETNFFVETHNWEQGRDWYAHRFPDEPPERGNVLQTTRSGICTTGSQSASRPSAQTQS
jgi:hypothetical protein